MQKKSKKSNLPPARMLRTTQFLPIGLFVALSVLMASFFVRVWPLEFVVSFTPQIVILAFTMLLLYATISTQNLVLLGWDGFRSIIGKTSIVSFAASVVMLVIVSLYSSSIAPTAVFSEKAVQDPKTITVGTFNKLYKTNELEQDAAFIAAIKADVMSIQEIDEFEVADLARSLNHDFSYITDCDCSAQDTEVAVISRYPIINASEVYENANSVIVRAVIDSPGHGQFVVYAVHMHIPYERNSYMLREQAFELLAEQINQETLPVFAMGDFNTTVYSPDMQNFAQSVSQLQNVISKPWPSCSWFIQGGYDLGAACARIDYVFVPSGSQIHEHTVGFEGSSDHRPVVVELTLTD